MAHQKMDHPKEQTKTRQLIKRMSKDDKNQTSRYSQQNKFPQLSIAIYVNTTIACNVFPKKLLAGTIITFSITVLTTKGASPLFSSTVVIMIVITTFKQFVAIINCKLCKNSTSTKYLTMQSKIMPIPLFQTPKLFQPLIHRLLPISTPLLHILCRLFITEPPWTLHMLWMLTNVAVVCLHPLSLF